MAGIATSVPIGQLAREIAVISEEVAVKSTRPLMGQCFNYLTSATMQRFRTATAPDGTPWAPLAMPRARPRDKAGRKLPDGRAQGKQKILRDNDLLMRSVTAQGAQGGISEIGETTLVYGTNLHYAGYHQHGVGPIRPVKKKALWWEGLPNPVKGTKGIPARPFLGVNNQDADRLAVIVADFYASGGRQ